MKIKASLVLLPLTALVLGGCLNTSSKSKKKSSVSTKTTTSETTPSTTSVTPTSLPPSETITKTKLDYTYDDYQQNNVYGLDNCPLTGSPKLLIIPVWFTDSSSYITTDQHKSDVRSDIEKAYVGTNEETGWRSVKTYYQEESFNTLNLQVNVSEWYECGKSSSYYANEDQNYSKTPALVNTAVTWYFNNNSSDSRNNYDSNGDGYMDGVMLIYAAPDYRTKGSNESNLWAYCYWVYNNEASTTNPAAKTFFWASYDFMYGQENVLERTGSSYSIGDCSHCNIDAHTFIHEMGHVLGLEDYYDYGDTELWPAGGFSMQDWNRGGHDPYSVMAYGWADPYIPTKTTTITINDFQSSHDVILLANHTGVNSPFDEYLLVELYTPTGLNQLDSDYPYDGDESAQGPTDTGIRIWHVDGRLAYATGVSMIGYTWCKESQLQTNPYYSSEYGIYHAFANSYDGDAISVLGSSYKNYNVLQFIRNDTSVTYRPTDVMTNNDLFKTGDSFTMTTFSSQFVKGEKMNDGQALGWTITVNAIGANQASITVTKA